mmetsp:Transcript_47624/g.101201  ORF Transcript_47624/g.101201 Transcript_47624/m.101201 type:complete len:278 (-) Transcript_47624:88-921(-)
MVKTPKEKRLKRYRSSPTVKISERLARAVQQRLFLVSVSAIADCPRHGGPSVKLDVLGSTGNVYEVTIAKVPGCNCPDAMKGNLCKHLLFAMIKVVGLPISNPLAYQSAYLTEELEEIVGLLRQRMRRLGRDVIANDAVRERHEAMKKGETTNDEDDNDEGKDGSRRKEIEGDCPICFDALGSDPSQLTYCRVACGSNFHRGCIQMWTRQPAQRSKPTCPACRQPWVDDQTGGKKSQGKGTNDEGYENLGSLQGQSLVRDTSTYHSSYDGYKRRRYY